LPAVFPSATSVNRAQNSRVGFESLPPLPIASVPFKFLKSLDLISLGMGLNDVPSGFAWELVEWKPMVQLFRAEFGVKPTENFVEVCDVVEVEDDTSGESVKIDLNLRIEAEPVHDLGGIGSESLPVFEDYLGDTFEKVGEIDLDEGPQTSNEPVPSVPTDETLTRERTRKRRIKTLAGRTDLPWV